MNLVDTLYAILPHGLEDVGGLPSISIIDWAEVIFLVELTERFRDVSVVACGGFTVDGMREADAISHALPSGRFHVYLETKSRRTIEQAQKVLELARKNGYQAVSVLCWEQHAKRAAWTFRHIFNGSGIEVKLLPVPAPYSELNYQRCLHGPLAWRIWNLLGWVATVKELYLSPHRGGL